MRNPFAKDELPVNGGRVEEIAASEMAAKFAPQMPNTMQIGSAVGPSLSEEPKAAEMKKPPVSSTQIGATVVVLTNLLEKQCKVVVDAEQRLVEAQEHLRQSRAVMCATLAGLTSINHDSVLTDDERLKAQDVVSIAETLRAHDA